MRLGTSLRQSVPAAASRPDCVALRAALGQFATGVAVVTTRSLDGRGVGLTVNSFSSLSLDPPLVAWCLSKRASSLAHFASARTIAIHVLSAGQEAIARRFAAASAERFSGVAVELGPGGVPLLDGAIARLLCTRTDRHEAGDHALFIEYVERCEQFPGEPLVFYGSQYCRISPVSARSGCRWCSSDG